MEEVSVAVKASLDEQKVPIRYWQWDDWWCECACMWSALLATANCIIIGHFSAFEPGLVAPFLTLLLFKTAGNGSKRPEI